MVRIRLRRIGSKNRPIYRVVVADSRSPRDGAFIETIGHYNPLTEPATVVVNEERALKWLRDGAQPTDTVSSLLRRLGIMDRFKQGSQAKSDS
jgi:small subunit ribosomal protein S16